MWAAKEVNKSVSSSQNPRFNQECSNLIELITPSVENDTVRSEVDLDSLLVDLGERKPMLEYYCNDHDIIRMTYIQKGPYQPKNHKFSQIKIGRRNRRFVKEWFHSWGSWLEYSPKKDAAFCLCCYLFMNPSFGHGREDVFSTVGFNSWNKTYQFSMHVGGPYRVHNKCFKMSDELMIQKQSIQTTFQNQFNQQKNVYRTRLNASIDVARLLLVCGLPFRGHDESEASRRKRNFLTILNWYAERVDDVDVVVLKNAAQNLQMTSPKIQKDIVNACAKETVKVIIEDLRDDYFSILVDES